MLSTPATSRSTPANTHQPLIRPSSFMRNPFAEEIEVEETLGAASRPDKCFLRRMNVRPRPRRRTFFFLLAMTALQEEWLEAPGEAIRVRGRPPLPRFRRGLGARASSMRVADAAEVGTRTNGKILGVDPREGPYTCSGTAIDTPSRSIVLTAGHCVLEAGSEGRDIVFVPAFDHGARPFGTYRAESVYAMPQWRHGENPDFDVAALRVGPSRFGLLADVVGARGFATGRSRLSAFQIFGYPGAHAGGEELRSCRAHGLGLDPLTN